MLKTYKGRNFRIKANGKVLAHATDCSFTTSRTMEGIASKDTNGEETTPGNYTWGVSTSYLVANATGDHATTHLSTKALMDLYQSGAQISVEFTTDEAGDLIITGAGFLESLNLSSPTNGVATGDASVKGTGDFTVDVVPAPGPVFTSAAAFSITDGVSGTFTAVATGRTLDFGFTGSGVLPTGVSFDNATGVFTWGTDVEVGTFVVTLVAFNADGWTNQELTITVT